MFNGGHQTWRHVILPENQLNKGKEMFFKDKDYRSLIGMGQILMVLGLLGFVFVFLQNGQFIRSVFQKSNPDFFRGFFTDLSGALLGASVVFNLCGMLKYRENK